MRLLVIVKVGRYSYSICARSGVPFPAVSAVRSLVYCASPCPALTTLTLMAGYFFSKTATSWLMLGTQDQKVSVVGVVMALSISAWVTWVTDELPGLAWLPDELDPDELEHASSAMPAAAAAVRPNRDRRVKSLRIGACLLCVMFSVWCSGVRGRARRSVSRLSGRAAGPSSA